MHLTGFVAITLALFDTPRDRPEACRHWIKSRYRRCEAFFWEERDVVIDSYGLMMT